MKRIMSAIFLIALFSVFNAQQNTVLECGTDRIMNDYYLKNPSDKVKIDQFNSELSNLLKIGKSAAKTNLNQIYEIPVVVHVVSDGSPIGSMHNKSDADVIAWINSANNAFAGIAANGIPTSGAIIPVKLVLAKRDPNCNATSGINRINASNIPRYVNGGVHYDTNVNGLYPEEVTNLAIWDTSKYYNIYIVKSINSNSGGWAGFSYLPGGNRDYTFVASPSTYDAETLSHEFGHALGLYHTHEGFNNSTAACPNNSDCTLNGDLVCDTEPIKNLLHNSLPSTCPINQTNPCTGTNYTGGERNVMSYSYCTRNLFTQGQSNRAIAQLIQYRQSLIDSPTDNPLLPDNNAVLTSVCFPATITNPGNNNVGIVAVKFGEINNHSSVYATLNNSFYENFTTGDYCNGITKTIILFSSPTVLTVTPGNTTTHTLKAYIDFNNDGQFAEATERVLYKDYANFGWPITALVLPPSNAVLNTPLRMRIIGDIYDAPITSGCYTPITGQIEDYSVTILSSILGTFENVTTENSVDVLTQENSVVVRSSKEKITAVTIYDASGKLIFSRSNINSTHFKTKNLNYYNIVFWISVTLDNNRKVTKKVKL